MTTRIDVTKRGEQWVAATNGQTVATARTKDEAIRRTAEQARTMPGGASVRIHKVNGTLQEERTYPRSADPRRSRG